jgi:hypothetical protein
VHIVDAAILHEVLALAAKATEERRQIASDIVAGRSGPGRLSFPATWSR